MDNWEKQPKLDISKIINIYFKLITILGIPIM